MLKRLSQRTAQSAKPELKPYQIHDTIISGFILRVQPNGKKIWKLIQNKKPVTLGNFPQMNYGQAEFKVKAILSGEQEIKAKVPTVNKFFDDFYKTHIEANHSRPKETESYIKRFKLGSTPLDEITLLSIESWRIKQQKKGTSQATINRVTNAFKALLNKAVDLNIIDLNPIAKLKPFKIDKNAVVRYLSEQEEPRLYTAMINAKPYLSSIATLALNSGLRRGELWNLQYKDINFKTDMLTVHGSGAKTGQTRHIPLNSSARMAIILMMDNEQPLPALPVFGEREFKKSWATLIKNADIQKFRFHDTRHHFASKLVMNGVDLNVVRELLGHSSLEMTLIYAHLAPHNLKNAVELIG